MNAESLVTDPIVGLLDTARALRVIASGEDKEGDGASPGVAILLRLLADHVDDCAQRLDNAGVR